MFDNFKFVFKIGFKLLKHYENKTHLSNAYFAFLGMDVQSPDYNVI